MLIHKLAEINVKAAESISMKEKAEGAWWEPKVEEKGIFKRKDLTHEILEVIYELGDVIEPTSQQPVVGDRYRSEIAKTAQLYGKSNSDFDYKRAPIIGYKYQNDFFSGQLIKGKDCTEEL